MKQLFVTLLFGLEIIVQAQSQAESKLLSAECDSLRIQYLDLSHQPILVREIKKFIREQQDSSSVFREGFGYIVVGDYQMPRGRPFLPSNFDDHSKDVVVSFFLSSCSYLLVAQNGPHMSFCQDCFPLYYSFVDNRLVLIYDENARLLNGNLYSLSSKMHVASLVEESLKNALDPAFEFKAFDKRTYRLSVEQRKKMSRRQILGQADGVLNNGRTYVQYFDGTESYKNYRH